MVSPSEKTVSYEWPNNSADGRFNTASAVGLTAVITPLRFRVSTPVGIL